MVKTDRKCLNLSMFIVHKSFSGNSYFVHHFHKLFIFVQIAQIINKMYILFKYNIIITLLLDLFKIRRKIYKNTKNLKKYNFLYYVQFFRQFKNIQKKIEKFVQYYNKKILRFLLTFTKKSV